VKTPNLARNKDTETAAGESTVCEEKDKGDEDWRISKVTRTGSDEEGKVEDIQ